MALQLDHIEARSGTFALTADLTVDAGARVAIIGASGSGKSTLLDVIAGFLPVQSGALRWKGRDITRLSPAERPVSILFQDTNLFPHLTIGQNLALALNPATGRMRDGDAARIDGSLARVGLAGFAERRLSEMSGGQQSRAAFARVLLQGRPVLLLDEPFAALGPSLKAEMLDLVSEVAEAEGLTVLLVSHDPQDARRFAEQTIVVEEGRVSAPEATGHLLDNPPPGLRAYLGGAG
ncbi:thiamine ABC transporter ATP-binding protein [Marivita geojedonensis]|uniref:thiamine ABC transporter ATP-binding protein n=1 Tax=Marivita geojedonensis TaxID=1123756 RepID=UPI000D41F080|nr:ATP-binding cassette domain-containing protein [Marivita geojedonensis]PRY80659.1 thiamine transport system ATP-binding protein [Marivita geojedonensis]